MQLEEIEKFDEKVFCTLDGKPVPVTTLEVVVKNLGAKGDKLFVEIGGVAEAVLIDANNPQSGAIALPEPAAVSISRAIDEPDNQIFLKQLSQALDLKGDAALVDGPEWYERLFDDNPQAVSPVLREKGMYFRSKKRNDYEKAVKFGNSPFFFNPFSPPKRMPLTRAAIEEWKAQQRLDAEAKRKAAEEKAAKDAEIFG